MLCDHSNISVAQCGLSELKMKFNEMDHFPDGRRLFSPELVEETLSDRLWDLVTGCGAA